MEELKRIEEFSRISTIGRGKTLDSIRKNGFFKEIIFIIASGFQRISLEFIFSFEILKSSSVLFFNGGFLMEEFFFFFFFLFFFS